MATKFKLHYILILFVLSLILASCDMGSAPAPDAEGEGETPAAQTTDSPEDGTEEANAQSADTPAADVDPTDTAEPTATPLPFPPLVLDTTPARGAELAPDGSINLTFDQPMDRDTVEAAFEISPAVDGDLNWASDTQVSFRPSQALERNQRYKITVAAEASSSAGLALNRPFELSFQTTGFLAVGNTQPADGTADVDLRSSITVLFNRPVVPLTSLGNMSDLPDPLTFDPPVDGEGEWLNTSIYQFTPSDTLDSATEYQVTVAAGLEDVSGTSLPEDYGWSFTTAAPNVVATYPDAGAIYVSPTSVISVAFNQPIDRTAIENSFVVQTTVGGAELEGDITWFEQGLKQPPNPYDDYYYNQYGQGDGPEAVGVETLMFTPAEAYSLDTSYSVLVGSQNSDADNQAVRAYAFNFNVVPPLAVQSSFPENGETVGPYSDLSVRFTAPVDPASIQLGETIVIEPQIAYTQVYTYFWDSNTELNIDLPSEPSTNYTVTLGSDIASRYGDTLGEDVSIAWRNGPADPYLYLHVAGEVSFYSTYTPTMAYLTTRNISQVNFSLYQLDEEDFMALNGRDSWENRRNFGPQGNPLRTWTLDTSLGDLNSNVIYGTNLAGEDEATLEPGMYYLDVQTSRDDVYPGVSGSAGDEWMVFVVSDINITMKTSPGEALVWLTDLVSTSPVVGTDVRLRGEYESLTTLTTDGDGVALGQHQGDIESWEPIFAFSDNPFGVGLSTWAMGIEPWQFNLPIEYYQAPSSAYFYTDRPIYRPGQTAYYKGIFRLDDDASYTLPPVGSPIDLIVYDAEGKEILQEQLTMNDAGSIHGQIELAEEASLGFYRIEAQYLPEPDANIQYFGTSFQVAEYRAPEFLVEVTSDQPEYRNGDTIEMTAQANYFFGGAVSEAALSYNILSEDYFFQYDGPGFYDFNDYDFSRSRGQNNFPGFGELIEEGTATTDAEGSFSVDVSGDISERVSSQRFTLEATVTDPDSNQVVSNRTQVIVHKGDFYVGIRPERYVSQANEESVVNLITVDWESEPSPNQDLTVIFNEHNWYSVQVESENGGFVWESVVEDIPVFTTTVSTDDEGLAQASFVPEQGGIYKVVAEGVDAEGNIIRSSAYMWVSGSNYINWRQENNDRLDLVTDKRNYEVGDTATILIPHPYSGTVTALISQERGHVYDYDVRTLESNSEQIEIPITSEMVPNMFVSVVILKGPEDGETLSSFKVGYAQLPISISEKEINITLSPDKGEENYQPGDVVTYTVEATDSEGNPVAAEFSLALVDKAVLSLADDSGPTILEHFWRERGLGVQTASGLSIFAERINQNIAPMAKGGGGGGFDESFSVVRGDFRDTAFWVADFTTGADGRGTVSTTLPDNLTTWVLTARGITEDTLVGDEQVEIVSTKPVLVRPVAPRFFVVGDEADLRMTVQNNTSEDLDLVAIFEAEGVSLNDVTLNSQEITLPAGERTTLTYPVTVGVAEEAVLRFGAKAATYEDAVEITLPIHRYIVPETVATAGVLSEDEARLEGILVPETVDDSAGDLTITLEPSLAAGMRAGLDYLEHFPYECTEQTVSRFLPNIITYRAYQDLNLDNPELGERLPGLVSQGLQRLYGHQNMDGGWGWFGGGESSPSMTAYVILGLVEAQRADFAVDEEVLERGIRSLENSLRRPNDVERNWQANQQAFSLYVLAEAGAGDLGRTVSLFDQREQLDLFGRAYLALTFDLLDTEDDSRVQTLLNDLTSAAIVSATGAHWEESRNDYYNMNSDTRSTAIILMTLSRLDPDNSLAPNAVRWLMSAREADYWETTQETAWAILGLTDWMAATQELEGNYGWGVQLNGDELTSGTVDSSNVDETETLTIAVAELLKGEVNRLIIERTALNDEDSLGRLYYTAHLEYYQPVENLTAMDRGLVVARQYSLADDEDDTPITEAQVGDIINVKVTLVAPNNVHYVMVEDPIPAGTEGLDTSLNTTSVLAEGPSVQRADAGNRWGWWWFSHAELRDEKAALFAQYLPRGTYEYTYQIRAVLPGEYRVIPTHAEQMYFPEVFGHGDGMIFTITE